MIHLLSHILGIDTQQSAFYMAWSGCIPALLTSLTILAATWTFYRRHNCEVKGCPRLGRHMTAGNHHVCRRHHPEGHLTASRVLEAHERANRAA